MISVERAKQIILKHSRPRKTEAVSLMDSLGCIVAEKICVPLPLPHWDNSAMDGFALRSQDTQGSQNKNPACLKIRGVLKAGDPAKKKINPAEAVRIMTGAPIPPGADTVLPKEMASVENQILKISEPIPKGRHIRRQGEELQRGTLLHLGKTPVHSGSIAFLAQIGKTKVRVHTKPKVAILTTGSELIEPGKTLSAGKIYDSNSPMMAAALLSAGIEPVIMQTLPDDPGVLRQALIRAIQKCDMILLIGGVSVGDYDFSKTVLGQLGVKTLFWKISQKPGKPLYFGKRNSKLIFGLPGNPASAFMCFYEYVLPAIRNSMGFQDPFLKKQKASVGFDLKRDRSKTVFLKSKTDGTGCVTVLSHQASHMISSLHETNGFLVVPPGKIHVKKGERVTVDQLP